MVFCWLEASYWVQATVKGKDYTWVWNPGFVAHWNSLEALTRSQGEKRFEYFFLFVCFLSALRHIPGNCCISTDELPWLCGSSSYRAPRTFFFHSHTFQTKGWNAFLILVVSGCFIPLSCVLKPTLPLQVVHLLKTLLQNSPGVEFCFLCWDPDSWGHFLSKRNIYCYSKVTFEFHFLLFLFVGYFESLSLLSDK